MRLTIRRLLTIIALLLAFGVAPAWAQKTVHVKGYTKKDGTVVKPHDRKAPGSSTTASASAPVQRPAPVPAVAPSAEMAPAVTAASETVYVTKSGDKYHRAGCRYLKKSGMAMALKDAASGHTPCSVCKPPTFAR